MKAHDVPEARESLMTTCLAVGRNIAKYALEDYSVPDRNGATRLSEELAWLINALDDVALWYVSPEMTDLLAHAWQSLPPTTLTHELPLDEYGMVVFGHQLTGIAADKDDPLPLDGYVWGPATLRRTHISPEHPSEEALSLAAFRHITAGELVQEYGPSRRDYWGPLGHTDWLWGTDIDDLTVEPGEDSEQRRASMIEDRRMMAAFWLLASQANIAETTDVSLPRPVRRRVERTGRSVPRVRLIDIRRPKHVSQGGHREVAWTHQWLVSAHWKQVAYGPGHSLRRPMLIAPYIKGPDDKPFVPKETVKVWK